MDQDQKIRILQDVIRIESVNDHEQKVAEFYQKLFNSYGIDAELVEYSKGRSNLVAEIQNGTGRTLALSGHLDVVKVGDESEWIHPPFSAHIKDDVIWGRGTSDMKAGLTALVIAMIELNENKRFRGKIKLLATVGEEVGALGSKQLAELGYLDEVDGMLIGEPCNTGVVHAHKGSLNYKVISKGVAAHSATPDLGKNAIENLLIAMNRISETIKQKCADTENEFLGKASHAITLVQGGEQINSIPDQAEYQANARTIPEFDNEAMITEIHKVLEELNQGDLFDLQAVITANLSPVETSPKSRLVQITFEAARQFESLSPYRLTQSMAKVLGLNIHDLDPDIQPDTPLTTMPLSATSDASQFMRIKKDLELVLYGPGMSMLNHKVNERLPLSQYLDFINVYKVIISDYLK